MIRVERGPLPAILRAQASAWRNALLTAGPQKERKAAEQRYRHPQVRSALEAMFHGKCGYCESRIDHVTYAHIEHFKPKARYPRLTFTWTNLLLACGVCNGTEHKGDNFPGKPDGGPLVDPCREGPEEHFTFTYDPITKLASVYGKTPRGTTTERTLGLNRPHLRDYRSRQVRKLMVLASHAAVDPAAKALLDEAKEATAEYAAFGRALFPAG